MVIGCQIKFRQGDFSSFFTSRCFSNNLPQAENCAHFKINVLLAHENSTLHYKLNSILLKCIYLKT